MQKNLALNRIYFIFALSIFLLISTTNLSQTRSNSKITGKITDIATGEPLQNVNIFLANTTIGAASGRDSEFYIRRVPLGDYDLVFSRIGYEAKVIHLKITRQQVFDFDEKLKSNPIKGEQVRVEAPEPNPWKKKFKKLFGYGLS